MKTQINKSRYPLWRNIRVVLSVVAAVGIATTVGCSQSSTGESKTAASAPAKAPAKQAPVVVAAKCNNCGQIASVNEIVTKGDGTGLGAVGGAVVGGVLGNQVGGGRGKDLATVAGAVGGAVAGNEIEKRAKSEKSYEIVVRLDEGGSQTFIEPNLPSWRPGDRVKIDNGMIQSNR